MSLPYFFSDAFHHCHSQGMLVRAGLFIVISKAWHREKYEGILPSRNLQDRSTNLKGRLMLSLKVETREAPRPLWVPSPHAHIEILSRYFYPPVVDDCLGSREY